MRERERERERERVGEGGEWAIEIEEESEGGRARGRERKRGRDGERGWRMSEREIEGLRGIRTYDHPHACYTRAPPFVLREYGTYVLDHDLCP